MYTQNRVNRDKTDFAIKERMLGLPASVKAPALAATGGRAVAQLKPPCMLSKFLPKYLQTWYYDWYQKFLVPQPIPGENRTKVNVSLTVTNIMDINEQVF